MSSGNNFNSSNNMTSIIIDDPRFLPKKKAKKAISKKLYKQMNSSLEEDLDDLINPITKENV